MSMPSSAPNHQTSPVEASPSGPPVSDVLTLVQPVRPEGDAPLTIDTEFGDYELLAELGRGGMGVVHKARQRSLNRIVAVKSILTGSLSGDEDLQRFRTEAEAAARLQHPNIVAIHEVGERNGQHFYTM